MIRGNADKFECAMILVISTASANKLMKGGAAMFAAMVKNQTRAIVGVNTIIP